MHALGQPCPIRSHILWGHVFLVATNSSIAKKKKGVPIKIKATELFRKYYVNIRNKLGSELAHFDLIENVVMILVKLGHSSARDQLLGLIPLCHLLLKATPPWRP